MHLAKWNSDEFAVERYSTTVCFLTVTTAVKCVAVDIESIVTAILILLSPLVLAIPLSLGWKWWVGTEPEHVPVSSTHLTLPTKA